MAINRRKRARPLKNPLEEASSSSSPAKTQEDKQQHDDDVSVSYEQLREQRIKENLERLQKLGVMDLTRNLNSLHKRPKPNPSDKKPPTLPSSDPPRRSSRLVNVARVTYQENKKVIKSKELEPVESEEESDEDSEGIEIYIEQSPVPEIYTEEHLKLLGDYETAWTLFSEGYGEDGEREYDQFNLSCHQCRQKTRGHRTNCSCCRLGSFCGDCLYMGYGENVLEANQIKKWTCPKCRGICNCSRCRKDKGWKPIGDIYTKVSKLGFKSVAHYLIQTRQSEPKEVVIVDEDEFSPSGSPAANPEITTLSGDKPNSGKYSDDEYVEEDDEAHDETDDGDDEESDNDDDDDD